MINALLNRAIKLAVLAGALSAGLLLIAMVTPHFRSLAWGLIGGLLVGLGVPFRGALRKKSVAPTEARRRMQKWGRLHVAAGIGVGFVAFLVGQIVPDAKLFIVGWAIGFLGMLGLVVSPLFDLPRPQREKNFG